MLNTFHHGMMMKNKDIHNMKTIVEYLSAKVNKNENDDLNSILTDLDTLLYGLGINFDKTKNMHDGTIWRMYSYSDDVFDVLEEAYHNKSLCNELQKKLLEKYEECEKTTIQPVMIKEDSDTYGYSYQQVELKLYEKHTWVNLEVCNFCAYHRDDSYKDCFCVIIYNKDDTEIMSKNLSHMYFLIEQLFK